MAKIFEGGLSGAGLRVAIVSTRWNDFIVERLVAGALDTAMAAELAPLKMDRAVFTTAVDAGGLARLPGIPPGDVAVDVWDAENLRIAERHTPVYDVVQQLAQPEDLILDRYGIDAPVRAVDVTAAE